MRSNHVIKTCACPFRVSAHLSNSFCCSYFWVSLFLVLYFEKVFYLLILFAHKQEIANHQYSISYMVVMMSIGCKRIVKTTFKIAIVIYFICSNKIIFTWTFPHEKWIEVVRGIEYTMAKLGTQMEFTCCVS